MGALLECAENGVTGFVGSVGDSYDNALSETVIGLLKTEVIYARGPWRSWKRWNTRP